MSPSLKDSNFECFLKYGLRWPPLESPKVTGQMLDPAQIFWISLWRWQFGICIFTSFPRDVHALWSIRTAVLHLLFIIPSQPSSKRGCIIRSQEVSLRCSSRTQGWARWGFSKFLRLWHFLLFFSTRQQQHLWSRADPECEDLIYQNLFNDLHLFFSCIFSCHSIKYYICYIDEWWGQQRSTILESSRAGSQTRPPPFHTARGGGEDLSHIWSGLRPAKPHN